MKNMKFLNNVLLLSLVALIPSGSFAMDASGAVARDAALRCAKRQPDAVPADVREAVASRADPAQVPQADPAQAPQAPAEVPESHLGGTELPAPQANTFSRAYGYVDNQIRQHPYRSAAIGVGAAALVAGTGCLLYKAYTAQKKKAKAPKKGAQSRFGAAGEKAEKAAKWCLNHKKITVPAVGAALITAAALACPQTTRNIAGNVVDRIRNLPLRDGLTRAWNWVRTHKGWTALGAGLAGAAAGCGLLWKYAADDETEIKANIAEKVAAYHDAVGVYLQSIFGGNNRPTAGAVQDSRELLQEKFPAEEIIQGLGQSNFKDETWAQVVLATIRGSNNTQPLAELYTDLNGLLEYAANEVQAGNQLTDELVTRIITLLDGIKERSEFIIQAIRSDLSQQHA